MKPQYHISNEDLVLISKILNNEADEDEKILFEKRIEKEPDFKSKAEEIKLLITGIREANLAKEMDRFHQKMDEGKKPENNIRRMNLIKFSWWAAAALVIIIAGIWFYTTGNNQHDIYANFYKPDPGLPTLMSSTENYDFEKAMVDYKMGEYAKAIDSWENLYEKNTNNDSLAYFLASAYLANNEPEKAKPLFEKMLQFKESDFLLDTYWYLGLIYLDENEIQKGKEMIKKSNHQNKDKILDILNKNE